MNNILHIIIQYRVILFFNYTLLYLIILSLIYKYNKIFIVIMEKRCVLIGMLGVGKTTIFNIICGQDEKSDSSMESNTKIIAQSQSQQGVGFLLLDTPGFGTYGEQVLNHSIGILAALTDGPVNRILIVIEYQCRLDVLKKEIEKIFQYVKEFRDIISIIITYKDQCKTSSENYFNEAQHVIRERYNIESVYFSGNDTTCAELCSFIDQALVEQGKVLEFKDSKFDHMMKVYIDEVLQAGKVQFLEQFNEFYDTVKEYIQKFDQNQEDSDQKLNLLISFIKENAKKIQENFEKSYAPFMSELDQINKDPVKAYYYHTVLKHSIGDQVQELQNMVNQKMKYPEDHPFRQLRRCPHCGTIWLKVAGCNKDIFCGNRTFDFENDFLLLSYQQEKYIFQIIDKKVYCIQLAQYEEEQAINEKKKIKQRVFYYTFLIYKQDLLLQQNIDQLNLPETFGPQFQYIKQLIFAQQQEQDTQKNFQIKYKQFSSKAKSEIQKKIVELNHQIQVKANKQIGCGLEINWQIAPIVNMDDIDVKRQEIQRRVYVPEIIINKGGIKKQEKLNGMIKITFKIYFLDYIKQNKNVIKFFIPQ
ncbi:hypothetical protein pb186bvf_016444 [Paramecium bursaria]